MVGVTAMVDMVEEMGAMEVMTMVVATGVMVMVMVEAMVVGMRIASVNRLGFVLQLDAIGSRTGR